MEENDIRKFADQAKRRKPASSVPASRREGRQGVSGQQCNLITTSLHQPKLRVLGVRRLGGEVRSREVSYNWDCEGHHPTEGISQLHEVPVAE